MSQLNVEKARVVQLQHDYNELANTVTKQNTCFEEDKSKIYIYIYYGIG